MEHQGRNYWDYLQLDKLLTLQKGFDEEEVESVDELHFIVVHQVYELWFKLVLRSIRLARDKLSEPRVDEETIPFVVHHLNRVSKILEVAVAHWKLVETLAPQDFLAFRDKLFPASGFQSFQMRELEILTGLEEADRIQYGEMKPIQHIQDLGKGTSAGDFARSHIEAARKEPTVLGALYEWMYRTPIQGSTPEDPDDESVVKGFLEEYLQATRGHQLEAVERLKKALGPTSEKDLERRLAGTDKAARDFLFAEDVVESSRSRVRRVRAAALFIESYRELPLLAWPRLLLDSLVEMEEQMLMFRTGHVRMVERVIGRRIGTGGSGGVDYLEKTLQYRVFRELWAVRGVLLPKDRLPSLQNAEMYGFVVES